jgi:hypothetical protein
MLQSMLEHAEKNLQGNQYGATAIEQGYSNTRIRENARSSGKDHRQAHHTSED